MAPPVEVEREDHLHRLVQENDTVIVSCFSGSEDGQSEEDLHLELTRAVTSTVLRRTNLNTVRAAGLLLPDDQGGGEDDEAKRRQEGWWLFFRRGEMVYAAGGSSTPGPKLSRLAALLERSPDTLAQLSRQDQVSRRQRLQQKATAAAEDEEREEHAAQHQQPGSAGGKDEAGDGAGGGAGGGEVPADGSAPPVLIFVAGDRSQVGKSSTCLGLLGSLLRQPGLRSSDLAYIKPATQCEKPQLVTEWCEANGVACRGIGPVVFYKGFTREFLKGGAGTSEDLLQEIKDAVGELSKGKQIVVVDGVGYPAVGSICGVSNGDVASALDAPVLLVGKSGVGDAVDSYNLNACFFEARGVRVLGGVFNRISTTGYYSLERCREAVTSYFAQANPNALPYGFVPEIASLKTVVVSPGAGTTATAPAHLAKVVASAAPKDPADGPLPGVGGMAEAGKRSEQGATDKGAVGAAETVQTRERLPVTAVENEEELETFVTAAGSERLVLVDFGAEWCKNCKAILPFVHGVPERLGGAVAVATADVDEAAELVDAHDVSTIPYFVLLRNGIKVDTYTGSSDTELLSKLKEHLPHSCSSKTSHGETQGIRPSADSDDKDGQEGADSDALGAAEALIDAFDKNVDIPRLVRDIRHHAATARRGSSSIDSPPLPPADTTSNLVGLGSRGSPVTAAVAGVAQLGDKSGGSMGGGSDSCPSVSAASKPAASSSRRKREEVEAEAAKQGASGG